MNILFFAHEAQLYGANRSLLNLIIELKKKEVYCFVLLPQAGPMCEELNKLSVGFEIVRFHWWVSSPNVSFFKNPKKYLNRKKTSISKIRATFRELSKIRLIASHIGADIIYSNSSVICVGFLLSKLIKKPHVWHVREFKDIDHNLYLDFGNLIFRRFLLLSDRVFFISKATRNYVFPTKRKGKFKIIYNGAGSCEEFEKYRFANNENISEFNFLIIGSINKNKGQEEAIKAFHQVRQKHNHVKLIIAGKGDQGTLRTLTKKLNIEDGVRFIGHVTDPHEAYKAANVVLMCSLNEAFGRVTAEAMMHSLPVIGLNNGGTKEIIIGNETGYLYNTFEELVEKMNLLASNPALCREMGERAWNHAKSSFNSESYAGLIYDQLELLGVTNEMA